MVQFYGSIQQRLIRLFKAFHVFHLSLPVTNDISYEDLKALLGNSQNLLLVDVRSKEEVDKGRIQGSIHIPGEFLLNSFTQREKKLFIYWYFSAFLSPCLHSFSWYSRGCFCNGARRIQGQVRSNQATVGCARAGVSLPDGQARGNSYGPCQQTRIREVNNLLVAIHCIHTQPILLLNRKPKSTS